MALESRCGQTQPPIKESGERIELMAEVDLSMSMVTSMKDIGPMIKLTAKEN